MTATLDKSQTRPQGAWWGPTQRNRPKPTPEKYCEYCGAKLERARFMSGRLEDLGVFIKRKKFCDKECRDRGFAARPVKPDPGSMVGHWRARRLVQKVACEICGSTRILDVHHQDRNYQNNALDNLIVVCRRCHLRIHRELKRGNYDSASRQTKNATTV